MKRYAFLLEHTGIGGGHYVVFEHAVRMQRRGNDIFIVTKQPVSKEDIQWHPEALELEWITYDDVQSLHFDAAVATFWKTARWLHRINASRYCFFVQSIETRFYHETEQNYRRYVESVYLFPVHYITQAEWIKDYLQRNYGHVPYLVHNGIRKDLYTPAGEAYGVREKGKLRVLIEGPLEFSFKNIEKTISLCRQAAVDEIWLLTSTNIKECEGVDRVFSRVPITETPTIYRSCDVLVKLSYVEGMFGPPLEMFHCGGTAIVYDVTGHEEYIRHDVNALVVEKNDEAKVIAHLNELKADPALLSRLKKGALETAARWPDWETQSIQFEEALSSIAASKAPGIVSASLLQRMADCFQENYEQVAGMSKFDYRYAELFVDTGLGFNEKQTQVKDVGGHETEIAFELNPGENLKGLRFDPVNDFCALHLEGIFLERSDGSTYEIGDFSTNAVYREQKELIFSTGDPQIYLSIFEEKLQKVIFRLRYIAIGKEAMGYFGTAHSRITARLSGALQERIVEAYRRKSNLEKAKDDGIELQRRIGKLESELTRKNQAVDAMTASASWRWTGPLRKARWNALKILNRIYRYRNASYKQILESGLFEPAYYAEQRGDKERVGEYPLLHYVRYGAKEGRRPHPLFDPEFYLEENPDAAAPGINPLVHFITQGAAEKRNPHPLFDTRFYLEQNPEAAEAGENPLSHYLKKGSGEGKTPHPLFDPAFYREQNPDVATSGVDPLVHYVTQGWIEKRDPHPLFDSRYYVKQNPDPSAIRENPLIHYLKEGRKTGKTPQILFDPEFYFKQHPDAARTGIDPLVHYVTKGGREKRNPHPLFDALHYLRQVLPDPEASRNPLVHYLQKGKNAGRSPHPLFDTAYYLVKNPDVANAGMDPLEHFIRFGRMDGRCPHKYFDGAYYMDQYPDVRESNANPLAHYLEVGLMEGRRTCSAWDLLHHIPLISLVMPVYDPEPDHLRIALDSVMTQIYPFWELCVVDDGGTNDAVRELILEYAAKDKRIKTFFSPENQGIAAASNQGIGMAQGEFVGFLDHDDVLSMDALMEITEAANRHGADMMYSDEQVIDAHGFHRDFIFKPDFSPDLLFSHNYITHLLVVKKDLLDAAGGFDPDLDGAQDFDLVLRVSENARKIHHIPRCLYFWRASDTSSSADPEKKAHADAPGKAALENTLKRRGIQGKVLKGNQRFFYRVLRKIEHRPLVSILIPFRDSADHLGRCLEAVLQKTRYEPFEVIGINNGSRREETLALMERFASEDPRVRFVDWDIDFNYSRLNNAGVSMASGEHIILMNDDVEVMNFDWIEALLEHSQRDEVGAVGGKLYYPDGSIQHAGIVLGIKGFAGHPHRGVAGDSQGYYNRLMCIQNVSAVTGALMMVKKRLYQEAGGLDEKNLSIALNDVDFCIKLMTKGRFNVWTPFCQAIHHESASRGYEADPEKEMRFIKEISYFQTKWKVLLEKGDPFYNPNLTLEKEDVSPKISVL